MSAHTPGPWRAVRNEVHVGNKRICANVSAGESLSLKESMDRAHANARLIAAAPELLEAAKYAISRDADSYSFTKLGIDAEEVLLAAIAKAEGR